MKTLVIVESPTKAKTLTRLLGPEYSVRASMGHIRDLPADELGVDIENHFKPTYHLLRQKLKTLKSLRDALSQANALYLATDPDREGEAIAWHLLQTLKPKDRPVQRVTFHEITPEAIHEAFAHPRAGLDMDLVNAQQARRVLDRLVGYQVSPLLWKTTKGKSAGRVQSVALRLVVDREREIRNFVPKEYWSIVADLAKREDHSQHFLARLVQIGDHKVGLDQAIYLKEKADADDVIAALEGATYHVGNTKQEKKIRRPWPPFTTSTLQQSASARLGMAPAETMKIAQELYEGLDIGEGKAIGLITYMRTDSTAVAPEAQAAVRKMLEQTLGSKYLPERAPTYKTKVKNAQEAHEAIRPTDVFRIPSKFKEFLSERQYKLYDLIWRRFVASQMAAATYDVTTIDVVTNSKPIEAPQTELQKRISAQEFLFRASGRVLAFEGFLRVWQEAEEKTDDEDEPQKLPALSVDEPLDLLKLIPRQHFTQPPPRYTEAALIKALEDRGIGRPSTYASILSTLKTREYVALEKRQLRPTSLGEVTCDALVAAFPDMMDYGFTAQVEDWLDDVSRGETEWIKALDDFYGPFSVALSAAESKMRKVSESAPAYAKPPNTDNDSANTATGKRPAKRTRSARRSKSTSGVSSKTQVDIACPKCGAPMVQRTGPRGAFLGCSRYPKCKGTRNVATAQTPIPPLGTGTDAGLA
jgi:DNA topoisomerase I